ncbi:MAG: tetratricopeptide repeat protein [candidate division WOR-3 bacterium]|nr:tetratricopeptide repeat protein [candidate division WOR-3 bacterium]
MKRSRISAGLIVAAVLAAAALAVLPPLLLGIGILWFIAPPLGLLAAAAILFRKNSLLMVAAILAVLAVSIAGVLHPMRLSPSQERQLKATAYFLKGQIFALQGDYAGALAAYEHSERAGLEHPWVAVQRAYCCNFLGRSENAYEIFARLMRDTLLGSLDVVHINYALSAMKSGNYKQGERAFWQALSYNFYPGYCYYQLGICYRLRNDQIKAEEMMTNAHRLCYERSQCSSILGAIAESRRDYARAEEFYRRALRENPENLTVYVKLGSLFYREGRVSDAREVLLEGVRISEWIPLNFRVYAMLLNNLGFVYAEEGQLSKAIPAFKQAIRVDPAFMDSYDNLAHLYIENKRFSDAVIVLRRALEVDPDYRPARRVLDQLLGVPEAGQPQ